MYSSRSSSWSSLTSPVDKGIKNDFPGDRFIPNRSLMDKDRAEEYQRKLSEVLDFDSEGRPLKMFVFRGGKACERPQTRHIDELRQQDISEDSKNLNPRRLLPKSAHRVLDAPGLNEDYFLNLVDWGEKNILAVALGSSIYLLNTRSTKFYKLMHSCENFPTSVAWSEDAKTIAIGFDSSQLQLWDVETSKLIRNLNGHQKAVGSLAWKSKVLASGSQDKSIINHDMRTKNNKVSSIRAHNEDVCVLKWSTGGTKLASGGHDKKIYVWETSKMISSKWLHCFSDHTAAVKALAWSPHKFDVLASGSWDRSIKIWSCQNGMINNIETKAQASLTIGFHTVCALEWSTHQNEILSGHGHGSEDEQLCLWKYPAMAKLGVLKGHTDRVMSLSQSPDGSTVVSASADESLRFWKIFQTPKISMANIDRCSSCGCEVVVNIQNF
ncbi:WD40 repeat [Macleaya cordata]|uniref:WD40 repeat n=1 Tax=Macleaya cordata TaxID=56857 RepID=A0A200PNP7_MACCD|nr:WD40 repeat [Macleaya cordata]